jgi:hypothetical protein
MKKSMFIEFVRWHKILLAAGVNVSLKRIHWLIDGGNFWFKKAFKILGLWLKVNFFG